VRCHATAMWCCIARDPRRRPAPGWRCGSADTGSRIFTRFKVGCVGGRSCGTRSSGLARTLSDGRRRARLRRCPRGRSTPPPWPRQRSRHESAKLHRITRPVAGDISLKLPAPLPSGLDHGSGAVSRISGLRCRYSWVEPTGWSSWVVVAETINAASHPARTSPRGARQRTSGDAVGLPT